MSTERAAMAQRLAGHERMLEFLVAQEPLFCGGDWASPAFWEATYREQDRVLGLTAALYEADRRAAYGDVAATLRLSAEVKQ